MTSENDNGEEKADRDSFRDHGDAHHPGDDPEVVSTADPAVAQGRPVAEGDEPRPDETIVAGTSPFVDPGRPDSQGHHKDDEKHQPTQAKGNGRPAHGHQAEPAHSGQSGWMNSVVVGVVALVCGFGGAWVFSQVESSKGKDQSEQAKKGDDDSSKQGDSSKGQAKNKGDSGSDNSGSTSADDSDSSKTQLQHLASRFDTLQQRLDSMTNPRDVSPPDVGSLRIKLGELSQLVETVSGLPARSDQMEKRLERMQEEIKGLRDEVSAARDRVGSSAPAPTTPKAGAVESRVGLIAGPPPAPPTSAPPSDPESTDAAMAEGIALFKKGKYPQADDAFGKLRLTKSQDARVWYFSALAHGFSSGQWDGDTRNYVMQGADRERAGMPAVSQIDSAFSGLSPAQGKDWLASYRSQLVKR